MPLGVCNCLLQAEVVVGVVDQPQIRHQHRDFKTLEEPHTAYDPVRQAKCVEDLARGTGKKGGIKR